MTQTHLEQVAAIETECFSHPWSKQSLAEEINNDTSFFLAACEKEKVVGYIGMSVVIDEGYIFNVAVSKPFRNRGIASALINELITYSKKNNFSFITLEVRQSNEKARSLYSKFGFIKVGERKNYYSDPVESAILMTKYF